MEQPPNPDRPVPPGVPPAGAPTTPVVPRGRRLRLVLAVLAGMTALACLGGAGVIFVLYDDATKIDRSTPDQVVDNYLRASLVERNEKQTALFRCAEPVNLAPVATLQREMAEREKNFAVKVSVSWSSLIVKDAGDGQRAVEVSMNITGSADGRIQSRRAEDWAFGVVDEDGWRVCSATKVG